MIFFLKKLIKFSGTYQPNTILHSFKKILRDYPDLQDVPFSGPKQPICPEQKFFGTNYYYYFHQPTGPFHFQNLKFLQWIQSYEDTPFLRPKCSICPKQKCFWKINKIILIYLLAPCIVQNLKKILPADPELGGCAIFGPKMVRLPK